MLGTVWGTMTKLNVGKIKSLSLPGLYGDGGTLYLAVSKSGAKSWIQRVVINGKRHDIGLGGWPVVTLAKARDKALDNRRLIRDGGDPLAEKRKAKAPTFRRAAGATFEATAPRLRSEKNAKLWIAQLERHAFKKIGDMPVDKIGREDVLRVLTPIWTSKPEAARKVRQRIRATLAWAEAHGFVDRNVAGDAISGALPAQPAVKANLRAMPYGEIPAALDTIDASNSSLSAKLALRFTILTAARNGEVRGAKWDEVDLDAGEWRIPGERMKSGAEHRVPLSDAALAVLDEARPLSGGEGLVFPSPIKPGHPMSDMTLTKILRTTGLAERATVHGFRSGFRDWCADTGKPREIAEAALAHTVGGVEGAYFRSDLFERRRALMQAWADFLTNTGADVVRLHG